MPVRHPLFCYDAHPDKTLMTDMNPTPPLFELLDKDPLSYRQQTRRASIRIMLVFAASAMSLSALLTAWLGQPEASNFRWNLAGVILGLLLTSALTGGLFRKQSWMQASIYGWRLKRSLMRIGNQMHRLKPAIETGDPVALCILRFYHLALYQMHQLDGNETGSHDLVNDMNAHLERLQALGLPTEQRSFMADWPDYLKQLPAGR